MTNWVNDWANYQAVDEDGTLWEYEYEPCLKWGGFVVDKGKSLLISRGNITGFETSMVKRDRSKDPDNVLQHLKEENEYLKKRNAELFSEIERIKKVANDLASDLIGADVVDRIKLEIGND